jgi:hypothetical protein
MKLFKRKTMIEQLEADLAALRARAETLSSRHTAADTAFLEAKSKLQRYHLEADNDADDRARAKLEAAVAACAVTRDGYADALGEVQAKIADTEQKIATERALVQRKAASEELTRQLDEVERGLPDYLGAARRLACALEAIHFHYEANEMARFVGNTTAQIEVAAGFALAELRATADRIKTGEAAIPREQSKVELVGVIEPQPEVRRMFALRSIKWKDTEGRQRHGLQFQDVDLPPATAQRGLRCGAVVPLTDPRRRELKGVRGGVHVNPNAVDLLDLDDEAVTRPPHVDPIMASDPVREANITVLDRTAEARTLSIAVTRL